MKKIMTVGVLMLAIAAIGDTAEIDGRTWTYFAIGKSATIISATKAGEQVGALPAKAVKGLWYQASWGSDLNNMTQGAKVQATGDELYLGVIKQTGNSGFYKVSVSEK